MKFEFAPRIMLFPGRWAQTSELFRVQYCTKRIKGVLTEAVVLAYR